MTAQNIVNVVNALDAFVNCISESEIAFDDLPNWVLFVEGLML